MRDERLSDLLILKVDNNEVSKINLVDAINKFAHTK